MKALERIQIHHLLGVPGKFLISHWFCCAEEPHCTFPERKRCLYLAGLHPMGTLMPDLFPDPCYCTGISQVWGQSLLMLPRELSSFTGETCVGAQFTSLPLKRSATCRRPFLANMQGGSQNVPLNPFKWPPGELLFHLGTTSLLLQSLLPHPHCSPTTQDIHKQHKFHIYVNSEDSADLPRLKLEDIQTAVTLHMDKRLWTISCFPSLGWIELDGIFTAYT